MKRRIGLFVVCLLAVLLPVRAAAACDGQSAVETRAGTWAASRSAMPWEELHCRATFALRTGESWKICGEFAPGVEFSSLTSVLAGGVSVNAAYYTLVSGERSPEGAFTLHLSADFAHEQTVPLTLEWTVYLSDACTVGADGSVFRLTAESESGETVSGSPAVVYSYGLSIFRGVHFADESIPDHPLALACFRLYYDSALSEPVAFRERNGAFLACGGAPCAHTRHTYLLRTGQTGLVRIEGLRAGTYYLQETRPPSGFSLAADTVCLTVGEDGTVRADGTLLTDTLALLEKGAETPEKESKTLSFYRRGCGVMVMLFAAVLGTRRHYL